jgi:hypothetical protein
MVYFGPELEHSMGKCLNNSKRVSQISNSWRRALENMPWPNWLGPNINSSNWQSTAGHEFLKKISI